MVEFGFFVLTIGLCLSLYGLIGGALSVFTRPKINIVGSAKNALVLVPVCLLIAALVLWDGLFTHDFSVRYIFRNSSVDMPGIYLFTAFWSALEGSHMLWTMLVTACAAIALITVRDRNKPLLPGLLLAFGIVHSFMLLLLVWASAPLTRMFPVGQFGAGMNALLQNPYMAAHPPTLFTGYSALVVPFGYGLAALLKGAFTPEWLISVRRWALSAWAILTIGIFLGGKWAYVELGWAGYWAWDPVENASFMPWLSITAGLHALLILDKTGRLPRLTIFLGMFAFILTFLGTFITRSGVISSVHSFAESNIGPAYLTFIVLLLTISLTLMGTKGDRLQGAARSHSWKLSKESTLLYTIFFLLFLLAVVMVGTLLPLIVEAIRGVKISIQQPFFNAFAPWIGIGLLLLIGIGNVFRWRSGKIEDPITILLFPALWAACLTAALTLKKEFDVKSAIGFYLILWQAGILILDLVYKLKQLRWKGEVFLKYNRPYFGSWIAHLGFLVAVAGFLGGYRGIEAQTTLALQGKTNFYGYEFKNDGLKFATTSNSQQVSAKIATTDEKGNQFLIEPMRQKFTNSEDWLNEIGVYSTFWHDIYLILASFDFKKQEITLKLHINPTVKFVWTSLVIMVIGAAVGLSHRFIRRTLDVGSSGLQLETTSVTIDELSSGSANSGEFKSVVTSSLVILSAIALTVFGLSGTAFAQEGQPKDNGAPVIQLDPRMQEIGKELRCPTCQGISVLESDTPQSVAMRAEIEKQLAAGKDKDEILSFFKVRYGEWILRKPDTESSFGLLVWAIPFGGIILGPIILYFALRRSRERDDQETAEVRKALETYLASKSAEVGK